MNKLYNFSKLRHFCRVLKLKVGKFRPIKFPIKTNLNLYKLIKNIEQKKIPQINDLVFILKINLKYEWE